MMTLYFDENLRMVNPIFMNLKWRQTILLEFKFTLYGMCKQSIILFSSPPDKEAYLRNPRNNRILFVLSLYI